MMLRIAWRHRIAVFSVSTLLFFVFVDISPSLILTSQQNAPAGRILEEFTLDQPSDDRLLDAVSLVEFYGDLVRKHIADAKQAFSKLFPFFFPKKEVPDNFSELLEHFQPQDLGATLRQEILKIGVEGTIALVAKAGQSVDWSSFGDVKKMEAKEWQSLIKAAKPNSKKILSFLGYKPAPSPSVSTKEVK